MAGDASKSAPFRVGTRLRYVGGSRLISPRTGWHLKYPGMPDVEVIRVKRASGEDPGYSVYRIDGTEVEAAIHPEWVDEWQVLGGPRRSRRSRP